DLFHPVIDSAAKVEPQVEGDLIVARPSGVETPRVLPNQFSETTLHGRVYVLVRLPEFEPPCVGLLQNPFQTFFDPINGYRREQSDPSEHRYVRKRTRDIIDEESAIGRVGREAPQRLVGSGGKAPPPERHVAVPRTG
ncbi:MAG TPA: hypothetical protein VFD97_02900, partial [Acidimicrobiia bacterium]|nr:hypothetical protein [Acidimicrobiia bacterium]